MCYCTTKKPENICRKLYIYFFAFSYQFDRVFKPGDNNEAVYNELNENKLIDSAMNGFNATIFAYGQTASGKTHTMMGSKNEKGIIQNAIDEIFDFIAIEEERQFQIQVSYMEIYNEIVTDLLGTSKVCASLKYIQLFCFQILIHIKKCISES